MGGKTTKLDTENAGTINNNINLEEGVHVRNDQFTCFLYFMAIMKLLEVAYVIYRIWSKNMKKKYQGGTTTAPANNQNG